MDKRPDPQQQLRDRDNKVYNSKAECKAKEMKELTGSPQIDPLSRKMAEVMTQRELAALGIQPEPVTKKPTFTIPKPKPVEIPVPKAVKFEDSDLPETRFEEPEPNPLPELQDPKEKTPEPELKSAENLPSPETKEAEVVDKKDDMLSSIKHIEDFQAELHREYPELALNEDAEGSSFHTNELNEYEEACKDVSVEQEVKMGDGEVGKEEGKVGEGAVGQIEGAVGQIEGGESFKAGKEVELKEEEVKEAGLKETCLKVLKTNLVIDVEDENVQKKGSEGAKGVDYANKAKTEATTIMSKTPRERSSARIQDSAFKSTLFAKPTIGRYTPRCHINLSNLKSSPIFYSFLVPPDAKMKSENGFASAASLRHFLLKQLLEKDPEPQDMYSRSLLWLKEKEDRLQKIRETEKNKDLDQCTFDPYFDIHEVQRKREEPFVYKASIRPDLRKEERSEGVVRVSERIVVYESLSPSEQCVRYSEGFNLKKLMRVGKVMINYRRVNSLK